MFPYCKHTLLVPPECLGLRLRPFCLGHVDTLTALDHPCVVGSAGDLGMGDTAVAAWVCSQSYETGVRLYQSGRASKELRALGLKWGGRPEKFKEQRDVLLDYFEAYLMAPPRWNPDGDVQPVIPWHLSVFAALQRDLKYTPSEVWNMPLPRALELFAAVASNRGDDSLVSIREQEILDRVEGM